MRQNEEFVGKGRKERKKERKKLIKGDSKYCNIFSPVQIEFRIVYYKMHRFKVPLVWGRI